MGDMKVFFFYVFLQRHYEGSEARWRMNEHRGQNESIGQNTPIGLNALM